MEENVPESSPSATDNCRLCLKEPARYTCPRCNVRYCSSDCYKCAAHAQCSELFYRDCFMEGLRDMETSGDEKRKMMDMLRRLEEENADAPFEGEDFDQEDEEEEMDLADRISGVDIDRDTNDLWERLSTREKTEFLEMVKSNRACDFVPLWQPWWLGKKSLVEEVGSKPPAKTIPPILTGVPEIGHLLKNAAPSKVVKYSVVNVIYGYAYAARLYNGEHLEMAVECADVITNVAAAMKGQQFSSGADAIADCFTNLDGPAKAYFVARDYSVAVVEDVRAIFSRSSEYVLSALSDCHAVLKCAKKELDSDLKSRTTKSSNSEDAREVQDQRRAYFNAQKKLEFLVSWAKKYGPSELDPAVVSEIELEICTLSTDLATHEGNKAKVEQVMEDIKRKKSKILIEEIEPKSELAE